MSRKKKRTYVRAPKVPGHLQPRYQVMMQVISGQITVTEGAKLLGMSRNHFQTLMHRGLEGFSQALMPGEPGRPAKPEHEAELEQQNERLTKKNEQLTKRVESMDRLLGVAGELLRERSGRKTTKKGESDDDDPSYLLAGAIEMKRLGLCQQIIGAIVGVAAPTIRRWMARLAAGVPLRRRRGPTVSEPLDAVKVAEVDRLVRDCGGLPGADCLRRSVEGVSRRQAAAIKRETLTAMERERIASCERVTVAAPGVMRGFDQMYVPTTDGMLFALISADAKVPYRTSAQLTWHYDGSSVATAIEQDFRTHGAPLVWRADRARQHDVAEVKEVLDHFGVLTLHGPPHHPGYYGQLERQNREHRAWLDALGVVSADALLDACQRMLDALNGLWRRRTLDWRTAEELWKERQPVQVDRDQLRAEVRDRAVRIRRRSRERGIPAGTAERLAIEQTLAQRGLLQRKVGERC
jgi:hypothetical protein